MPLYIKDVNILEAEQQNHPQTATYTWIIVNSCVFQPGYLDMNKIV
jgi:hypothetical protein